MDIGVGILAQKLWGVGGYRPACLCRDAEACYCFFSGGEVGKGASPAVVADGDIFVDGESRICFSKR